MRLKCTTILVATLGWLSIPCGALASDDVAEQLRAMQERLMQLEDKLDATEDQLEAANERMEEQETLIEEAGIARGSSSGLADFIDTIELGGWISASWFYNFNDPDGRVLGEANTGAFAYPFKPDANSFSFDQLWFEIERAVSEENRAGFRADIVFGKDAGLLSGDFGAGDGLSGNDLEVYQAYIQYLAPIGEGVTFQFGKFATLIGAEVVQAPYNFNITRGHVYNLFQPITHTGLLASTAVAGLDVSLGFVNETRSFPARDIDLNDDKAVLWSVGSALGETMSWSFNGTHGSSDSGQGVDEPAGNEETILDFIFGFDPNENFSAYVNADWIDSEASSTRGGNEFDGYGVAVAGRYAVTQRTGVALRGEWVDLDFDRGGDFEVWGLTSTVDYKLTEKLMVRGEVRYDNVSDGGSPFVDSGSFCAGAAYSSGCADINDDDQVTAGVEVIYSF